MNQFFNELNCRILFCRDRATQSYLCTYMGLGFDLASLPNTSATMPRELPIGTVEIQASFLPLFNP